MTHAGNEAPRVWLKQVPNNRINDDGIWTTQLIDAHHTVMRAHEPPHGAPAVCSCGQRGRYDLVDEFEDAVWIAASTGEIICFDCFLK